MAPRSDPTVIACSLELSQLGAQLERWQNLTSAAEPAITPSRRGLRLTFPTLPGVEEELQSLVALERRCCSFADWSIRSDDSRVVLDVSADGEEAIAAVHGMFGRLRSEPGTAPMPR